MIRLLHKDVFVLQYETAIDSENPESLQPMAYHTVNRRYSEFLNLQTRLEEKPELRKILKSEQSILVMSVSQLSKTPCFIDCLVLLTVDVKGPKKIFPELPFGNMDSDKVEARKSLLETFLRVRYLNA